MQGEITLGYWGIRGRAQVIRLLLNYTGANWKDKIYTNGDEWFNKDKKNLGILFPNLPYMIHGNLTISESLAIPRYIIKISDKKQLLGKDLKDQSLVDNVQGVLMDVLNSIIKSIFSENSKQQMPKSIELIKKKFGYLQNFYGEKQFALGYLTLVDFHLAEISYYIKAVSNEVYQSFPFIEKTRLAFEQLPETKAYYEKQNASKMPFLPPYASVQPVYEK